MRLPIYRKLDERLRILGLSITELGALGVLYVLLAELLSFWRYGFLCALLVTCTAFLGVTLLHKHFESNFLRKFIRFAELPEGLPARIRSSHGKIRNK